jgi:hypothetical protein
MAAKALCALIPLRAVPVRAAALLEDVNSTLAQSQSQSQSQSGSAQSKVLCHNALHGTLSLCHEVLDSLKRRMAGVGDNRALMSVLQVSGSTAVTPETYSAPLLQYSPVTLIVLFDCRRS